MTLRKKTLFIGGTAFFALIVIFTAISFLLSLKRHRELEERVVRKDLRRVVDTIEDEAESLDRTTGDWAMWDDSYDFIEHRTPAYIERNIDDYFYTNLRLSAVIFVDNAGRSVVAQGFDLNMGRMMSLPQGLETLISPSSPLIDLPAPSRGVRGVVFIDEGPFLMASRPVLRSNGEGPSNGKLIMGRSLDVNEVWRIAQKVHVQFTLHPAGGEGLSPELKDALSELSEGKPVLIKPLDRSTIAGYTLIHDIFGKPAGIVRTLSERDIFSLGVRDVRNTFLLFFAAGIVLTIVVMWFVGKAILFRLKNIINAIIAIGKTGDMSHRVPAGGSDELGEVGSSINRMLEALSESRGLLESTEARYRGVIEQASEGLYLIDIEGARVIESNPAFIQMLGYTDAELRGLTAYDIIADSRENIDRNMRRIVDERSTIKLEREYRKKDGSLLDVEASAKIITIKDRELICVVVRDISERKRLQMEREKLIGELENQLSQVKTLSGLLPICANCKKIRDDEGYWKEVEAYFMDHSDAVFSHSLCPECARKLYPDYFPGTSSEIKGTEKS